MRKKINYFTIFKLDRFGDLVSKRMTGRRAKYVYSTLLKEYDDELSPMYLNKPIFNPKKHYRLVIEYRVSGIGYITVHREGRI